MATDQNSMWAFTPKLPAWNSGGTITYYAAPSTAGPLELTIGGDSLAGWQAWKVAGKMEERHPALIGNAAPGAPETPAIAGDKGLAKHPTGPRLTRTVRRRMQAPDR